MMAFGYGVQGVYVHCLSQSDIFHSYLAFFSLLFFVQWHIHAYALNKTLLLIFFIPVEDPQVYLRSYKHPWIRSCNAVNEPGRWDASWICEVCRWEAKFHIWVASFCFVLWSCTNTGCDDVAFHEQCVTRQHSFPCISTKKLTRGTLKMLSLCVAPCATNSHATGKYYPWRMHLGAPQVYSISRDALVLVPHQY